MTQNTDGFAIKDKNLKKIFYEVSWEFERASERFGKFNSIHEGIGVIREEYLELEKESFTKNRDYRKLRSEAIQLAAMAIRFIKDFE